MTTQELLLIDDDPTFLEIETAVLTQEGFSCFSVQTGKQGIRTACQRCPDLILLDILLPDLNGFRTCQALRHCQEMQHTPIILLSVLDTVHYIQQGFESGASDYIMKPVCWIELFARIRFHLIASQLGVALEHQKTRTDYWKMRYTTLEEYVMYWLETFGLTDPHSFHASVEAFKNTLIQYTLLLHEGKVREAAHALHISTRSFRRHLKQQTSIPEGTHLSGISAES